MYERSMNTLTLGKPDIPAVPLSKVNSNQTKSIKSGAGGNDGFGFPSGICILGNEFPPGRVIR